MSGGKRKTEKADARGGPFFLLPQCLLTSEAFRTLPHRAVHVLLALCSKHNGFNNGAIGLGYRELADLIGSRNNEANQTALCTVMERGFVTLERDYPRGHRLAHEYRLTFVPTATGPATNDYLQWQPGDAGTHTSTRKIRKKRVAMIETRRADRVAMIETGAETSRCDDRNGGHENPPFSPCGPVAMVATHIVQPSVGLSPSTLKSPPNSGGPVSAAPDSDELRSRTLALLRNLGRGWQGCLAQQAGIPGGTLSKFLNRDGPLNEQARIRLTCALPRTEAAARTNERISA